YEYFRQARAQRMPTGLWDRLMPVMQLTRPRMVQLLNILQMPSPLLELADRYRLPERVLREVLSAPQAQWERTLRFSIQNQLTSDEVAEVALASSMVPETHRPTKEKTNVTTDPGKMAARAIRRFAFILNDLDEFGQAQALDDVADTLVSSQQSEGILHLLEELQRLVKARTSRR
ncbi:MAG: hypothetical protein HGA53_03140, partial [Anaerolineaceae bacterium]|nr:hypothetical protein [Anaerolineaceae bacterium]